MAGHFGEEFQQEITENGNFDILSIAIGGAGSRNYTMTMRNNCCGYIIRETHFLENYEDEKRIRTVEYGPAISGKIVGKKYEGKLQNVFLHFDPHIVIISLGHNYINDHQNLIDIIQEYNPNIQIVWVGPMLNRDIQAQMYSILQVVQENDIFLVRSDDIVGSDTAGCLHLGGRTVERWSEKVVERMQNILIGNSILCVNSNLNKFSFDTLPVQSFFVEDSYYSHFIDFKPKHYQIVISIFNPDDFQFYPRFLNRTYSAFSELHSSVQEVNDIEGNTYHVLRAGNSYWMSEDLKTKKYNDSSSLSRPEPRKYFFYEEEPALCSHRANAPVMYTWYALSQNDGICPKGWHVPDVSEWVYLFRVIDHPEEMLSGAFQFISSDGRSVHTDSICLWWSVTSVDDHTESAWAAGFDFTQNKMILVNRHKKNALPVRCVKD